MLKIHLDAFVSLTKTYEKTKVARIMMKYILIKSTEQLKQVDLHVLL